MLQMSHLAIDHFDVALGQRHHFKEGGWMDRMQSSLLVKCKLSKLDSCNVTKENILIISGI